MNGSAVEHGESRAPVAAMPAAETCDKNCAGRICLQAAATNAAHSTPTSADASILGGAALTSQWWRGRTVRAGIERHTNAMSAAATAAPNNRITVMRAPSAAYVTASAAGD